MICHKCQQSYEASLITAQKVRKVGYSGEKDEKASQYHNNPKLQQVRVSPILFYYPICPFLLYLSKHPRL